MGWRAKIGTLKGASLEFKLMWDTASDALTAIREAFLNNTAIEFAVFDGASNQSWSRGLRGTMAIINFTRSEPLEEDIKVRVTAGPTYSTTAQVGRRGHDPGSQESAIFDLSAGIQRLIGRVATNPGSPPVLNDDGEGELYCSTADQECDHGIDRQPKLIPCHGPRSSVRGSRKTQISNSISQSREGRG